MITENFSILFPNEWQADQDEETIIITDQDEISILELTPLFPEKGSDISTLLDQLVDKDSKKVKIADYASHYHEFEEDDMFWREWVCEGKDFLLMLSHGSDIENRNMDDAMVDEILSTLIINMGD